MRKSVHVQGVDFDAYFQFALQKIIIEIKWSPFNVQVRLPWNKKSKISTNTELTLIFRPNFMNVEDLSRTNVRVNNYCREIAERWRYDRHVRMLTEHDYHGSHFSNVDTKLLIHRDFYTSNQQASSKYQDRLRPVRPLKDSSAWFAQVLRSLTL